MIEQLEALVQEYTRNQDSAFDLWTWLPSYRGAEKAHGDYGSSHQPSVAQILQEACNVFASQQYPDSNDPPPEVCPCQECGHGWE